MVGEHEEHEAADHDTGVLHTLPLFPLGSVLVPGAYLPLQVFEPRYRALVEVLLRLPPRRRAFGVIGIRAGHEVGEGAATALFEVGCVARVRSIDPQDDGRYLLETVGGRRFRLEELDFLADTAYPTGLVRYLGEPFAPPGEHVSAGELGAQVAAVASRFRRYLSRVATPESIPDELPDDATNLSYLIASLAVLDRADRHLLLQVPDALSRLRLASRLLAREELLLRELNAIPATDLMVQRGLSGG